MIWDVNPVYADMAELVDALSSDGSGYAVRVRLSLSAPFYLTFPYDLECLRSIKVRKLQWNPNE